jgi:3-dehydroquinate dehydratase-2
MKEKKKIMIIHGPNLNLLGKREPEIYGTMTLEEINTEIIKLAEERKIGVEIVQSNSEGSIIDALHLAMDWADGIVINPGAYTHYSLAIADAVRAIGVPVIEVHLSNIYAREEFRRHSVIVSACVGQISGLGWRGYLAAVNALMERD